MTSNKFERMSVMKINYDKKGVILNTCFEVVHTYSYRMKDTMVTYMCDIFLLMFSHSCISLRS